MLSKETIITLLVLVLFLVVGNYVYSPLFDNPKMVYVEAPLEKNSELKLTPGETYVYAYMLNGSQVNMSYAILDGNTCTRILVLESVNLSEACLDKWGMDELGYNATLENQQILLFKPWMLALEEGWIWNNTMYMNYDGTALSRIVYSEYRVVRIEEYMNRTAFVVEIKTNGEAAEYDWIDAEKRIILKIVGQGYEINLVEESTSENSLSSPTFP